MTVVPPQGIHLWFPLSLLQIEGNCHTDLGPVLVLFSKTFKPHSADIQICFDTLSRENFSPLHLKNLRGDTNGLLVSDVLVLLVFLPATTVKEIFSNVPLKISNSYLLH